MERVQPDTEERTPSSRVLEDLLHRAPPECFTLGWLILNLQQRSFGIVVLFLGLLATTPIGSYSNPPVRLPSKIRGVSALECSVQVDQ
jgi:hypothetical protein